MLNLVSTSTPKSVSGKVLSSWAAPRTNWCLWLLSPRAGWAFRFVDLHKASISPACHGSSGLTQSIRPSCWCILSTSQPCPLAPNRHSLSAHPSTTLCQAQPLCTTNHPGQSPVWPPHLSLWACGISQRHPCHPNVQLRWAGRGSAGIWPQTLIQAMLCIKRRGKY